MLKQSIATMAVCVGATLGLAHGQEPRWAAKLTLPSSVLDRSGAVPVVFRFEHGHTGDGTLHVRWSDSLGRVVMEWSQPVTLTDEIEFKFPLDLTRAVAMKNTVEATLTMKDSTPKGVVDVKEKATAEFIAKPVVDGWKDYQILMYQNYPANVHRELKTIGVNGGEWVGRTPQPSAPLVDTNTRWYAENIATDFYAEYHRWRSDRPVQWSFDQARELYKKDPQSKEAFKRHPSFWDPFWRKTVHDRVVETVKRYDPYKPYFYSLSDESGIADLGAQWDFDFSDQSLIPMREWLRNRYGTLAALNREWETSFTSWNTVTPFTTNEAMERKGENFAPWADFKEWMDISYADALHMGVDAAHEADPQAYVGIVGAQKPGWGGYDYSRLSRAVNVMEPYDIGGSVKLVHSLNPAMPLLSTTFASGDWERHRVWFELLQGNRGLILWDEKQSYIRPDGSKGEAGQKAEAQYNELRDGMGALMMNSVGEDDGIAIHYSQPSMRTEWMLERRPDGSAWAMRDAKFERTNNNFMRLRESWGHAIEDQGLQYNYVSYLQVEEGELLHHGYRMLVLPHSSSLSPLEVKQMRAFVAAGGVLVADGMPGTFNEHSRRLPQSQLADLFDPSAKGPLAVRTVGKGKTVLVNAETLNYLQDRIAGKEAGTYRVIADLLAAAGLRPRIAVTDDHGKPPVGLITRTFQNGSVRLLTVQSNPQQRVDELGPADFHSNERFNKSKQVHVALPQAMYVYDVRHKKALGRQQKLSVTVDPYEPLILALSATELPRLSVSLPEAAPAGSIVPISFAADSSVSQHVYHLEVRDPAGHKSMEYSQNVVAHNGAALVNLPLAANDAAGAWTVQVKDMLTGEEQTRTLQVTPAQDIQ